jgi:plasmid stabilization system protein ParE
MPKYQVDITRIAESDVKEICSFISRDSPLAGEKWIKEVERQIQSLENFPLRCPVIPETQDLGNQYRHLIYGYYRTIFRIEGKRVIILRVIHGARQLDMKAIER